MLGRMMLIERVIAILTELNTYKATKFIYKVKDQHSPAVGSRPRLHSAEQLLGNSNGGIYESKVLSSFGTFSNKSTDCKRRGWRFWFTTQGSVGR